MKAKLLFTKRGFGGDNAVYEAEDGTLLHVGVGWALMARHQTTVSATVGEAVEMVLMLRGQRYVQPDEALAMLGYEADTHIDFCDEATWREYERADKNVFREA